MFCKSTTKTNSVTLYTLTKTTILASNWSSFPCNHIMCTVSTKSISCYSKLFGYITVTLHDYTALSIYRGHFSSYHYDDVIMTTIRLKSPASLLFTQSLIQTQMKENIKAPRHWPLCGEFTGTGEFPAQRASHAENVSIWWRHHVTHESHTIARSRVKSDRNFIIAIIVLCALSCRT